MCEMEQVHHSSKHTVPREYWTGTLGIQRVEYWTRPVVLKLFDLRMLWLA